MAVNDDYARLAEQHAREAELLLGKHFGVTNDTLRAQVHATLAVYYIAEHARRQALQSVSDSSDPSGVAACWWSPLR